MTEKQQEHLRQIEMDFASEVHAKYEEGVKHHGGNLWEKSLSYHVQEAIKETIDQYVYLHGVREKIRLMEEYIKELEARPAISGNQWQYPNDTRRL
jgi:hypothetical protein